MEDVTETAETTEEAVETAVEETVETQEPSTEYAWRDLIQEDLATSPSLEKFNGKSVDDVVRSYVNLEKKLGGNPIVKPSEEATQEQWDEYYTQLGRPAEPDQYELPVADEYPEGFNISPDYEKSFKEAAYKAGASEKAVAAQWKALQETAIKDYQSAVESNKSRLSDAHKALEKEWGKSYGDKIKFANRAAAQAGGEELLNWMKQTGADKEVMLIKAFAKFGEGLKEDSIGDTNPAPSLTPREAQSKINKIMANKDHPYNDKKSPGHDEAIKEVADLFEFVYPGEATNRKGDSDTYEFGVQ